MLIAVDTNVLLDLALGVEVVIDALETIQKRIPGVRLVVLPTVLQELAFLLQNGETDRQRNAARAALVNLPAWKLEPLNLIPVGHGIVERIAERNDSFVIAEAALIECGILLSTDAHLRGAPGQRLTTTPQWSTPSPAVGLLLSWVRMHSFRQAKRWTQDAPDQQGDTRAFYLSRHRSEGSRLPPPSSRDRSAPRVTPATRGRS